MSFFFRLFFHGRRSRNRGLVAIYLFLLLSKKLLKIRSTHKTNVFSDRPDRSDHPDDTHLPHIHPYESIAAGVNHDEEKRDVKKGLEKKKIKEEKKKRKKETWKQRNKERMKGRGKEERNGGRNWEKGKKKARKKKTRSKSEKKREEE